MSGTFSQIAGMLCTADSVNMSPTCGLRLVRLLPGNASFPEKSTLKDFQKTARFLRLSLGSQNITFYAFCRSRFKGSSPDSRGREVSFHILIGGN